MKWQQQMDSSDRSPTLLSVVVPVYNEQEVLDAFIARLSAVLSQLDISSEIVFVNDGSRDSTLDLLRRYRSENNAIAIVDLSRNFGKEIALTAGIDHAGGDVVIVIDADLQDPPELIPTLLRKWQEEDADVVYAQRVSRTDESRIKRTTAYAFYRLFNVLSGQANIPIDTGDFRLLSRRAVDALKRLHERHRFMKGLFSWIGFRQVSVPYHRDPRFAGDTKWSYRRLWTFSIDGITSFSTAPLKISSYVGLFAALIAMIYGAFIMLRTIVFGNPVAGYPSLLVIVLFMGGVQLICLGIIGEYLGRTFNETKQRPLYLLNFFTPSERNKGAKFTAPLAAGLARPQSDHGTWQVETISVPPDGS